MQTFFMVVETIAFAIEALGVAVMLLGFLVAGGHYFATPNRFSDHKAYVRLRHSIGRSILLGLDLLIAGDIIKTVVISGSELSDIMVLAAIVLIRTFLSLTLHLELEGRWPWQGTEDER